MEEASGRRTRPCTDASGQAGVVNVASLPRSPPLQSSITKSPPVFSIHRQRNHHHHHVRRPMTPPPPPTLLLTHHLTAAVAALLVLVDPASAAASRDRKRRRLDVDGESDSEEREPIPLPSSEPEPEGLTLPLPPTSPDHYPLAFRVSAPTFNFLSGLLDPLLSHPSLPSSTLLALALARLATGLPYPTLAALFRVSASAPRAASRRLRRVLLANFRFWLAFPAEPSSAYASSPLPSCRGALACARFDGPDGPLAAQLVAGASSRILSLAAGFRGDRTDLEVLKFSSLYQELEQGRVLDPGQYLAGDGDGYPLLPWLMVPFPGPAVADSPEADFNAAHDAMCRKARRTVRSLKGWGAIARLRDEESPRAAVACIGTCAMLHNVLLAREDHSALAPEEAESDSAAAAVQRRADDDAGVEDFEIHRRASAFRGTLAATMRGR